MQKNLLNQDSLSLATMESTTETPHTFVYEDKSANHVALAGTFNHWSTDHDLMEKIEGRDRWTITKMLKPGRYEYKFVIDGEKWVQDPLAEESDSAGSDGTKHSVVTVGNLNNAEFDNAHKNKPVVAHDRGIAYNQ